MTLFDNLTLPSSPKCEHTVYLNLFLELLNNPRININDYLGNTLLMMAPGAK